jgi:hypothetical protein
MLIDSSNFTQYAYANYNNPQCVDIEEFYSDLKKFKYLKKLFTRYKETGVFSERLVLNHIITLQNLFGVEVLKHLMEYKIEKDHWPALKACLYFLRYITDDEYIIIQADPVVTRILSRI